LQFRLLFRDPIWDINGTPKVIPSKIFSKLKLVSNDDLIDAEVVAKCAMLGVNWLEVPIFNTARVAGRSTTNFKSALKMYLGMFRIRRIIAEWKTKK
jgi:hypothetical protein